jgi:hypothetical protein
MPQNNEQITLSSFPVSVIMERRELQRGMWTLPQWDVVGVVAGANVTAQTRDRSIIRSQDGKEQFLWSGFSVELHRSGAENYWHNLVSKSPSLFVICQPHDEEELAPSVVTADYDEASTYMEAEGTVFSVPIPPEVYQWLERFVVENYLPQEPKKRKRVEWKNQERGDRDKQTQADQFARRKLH